MSRKKRKLDVSIHFLHHPLPIAVVVLFHRLVIDGIVLDVVCHQKRLHYPVLLVTLFIASHEVLPDPQAVGCLDVVLQHMLLPLRYVDEIFLQDEMVPLLNWKKQGNRVLLKRLFWRSITDGDHRLDKLAHVVGGCHVHTFIRRPTPELVIQVIVQIGLEFNYYIRFHSVSRLLVGKYSDNGKHIYSDYFFYSVSVQVSFRFYNFYTFYKLNKVLYFNYIRTLFVSTKCRKTVYKVWFCRRIAEK